MFLPLWSQVNVKVGYNIGYSNPENHNLIYQRYNEQRPWLTKPFKDMHTINGLQLGLRYRFESNLALEATWQNQYHRRTATGVNPINNRNFSQSFSFRNSSLGLGWEYFIGPVSLGASYNIDQIRYKSVLSNIENIFKENGRSSTFFLSYNITGSDFFHFSIRPYAQISWQAFDLGGLFSEFIGDNTNEPLEEGYDAFGIMLIFYNGYQ